MCFFRSARTREGGREREREIEPRKKKCVFSEVQGRGREDVREKERLNQGNREFFFRRARTKEEGREIEREIEPRKKGIFFSEVQGRGRTREREREIEPRK